MALPKGYKHSKETRKARSGLMKQKWADPEYRKSQTKAQSGRKAWNKGVSNKQTKDSAAHARKSLVGKDPWNKDRKCPQLSGKNNGSWKGGITKQEKSERIRFRKKMQKKIFERDDYTCQICGKRGGKLQVDHIQPWAQYVEGRFDTENCRTLCMSCHYFITFGRSKPKDLIWGHNLERRVLP